MLYKLERLEYLIGQILNVLHFLSYDCVNFEEKKIKKYFQFLSRDGGQFKEEVLIDEALYEFKWYFQGFITIPSQKQITIYVNQQTTLIFSKSIQIEFPQEKINLNLIIGGQYKIISQNSLENKMLSYYPGEIKYYLSFNLGEPNYFQEFIKQHNKFQCTCLQNSKTNIGDFTIQKQEQFLFVPQKINCQQFLLSSWVKIKEINSNYDEFYYQLFKLSGNFNNPKMTQDNLSAFQLFYKICGIMYQWKRKILLFQLQQLRF
ncbi:unnamed protein product [Paramecium sonneborni]|uniref:Uncharacterized protein n=1 Tax=Paramecium sonneborni TaxID=65129 RepID=A0A8S1RB04_9CILI|nr:unnamed protein product [Paramecium sonneborni]